MFRQCYACSGGPSRTHPSDQPRSARRRGAAHRARRSSGYRSPVSQGSRNPRTRNATKVAAAPGAAVPPDNTVADDTPDYPGKRFGLPMSGPSSVAPMGRRLIALIVDWVLCYLIASSIVRPQRLHRHRRALPGRPVGRPAAVRRSRSTCSPRSAASPSASGCSASARSARTAAAPASGGPRCAPCSCCSSSRPACPTVTCAACTTARPTRSSSASKRCCLGIRGWRAPLGIGPFGICIVGWSAFSR